MYPARAAVLTPLTAPYNTGRGGPSIKTLLLILTVSGALVLGLAWLRVPFAVRLIRRLAWLGWVYVVVVILSAARLVFFS